ncbi:MAG: xanthine dehydrogenase molybdopterin binding subunit [Bacteroidales bacterium]|nr:xanthine dehydrogenase molybdopterin binding subunit [Bacteroidales bacterium]
MKKVYHESGKFHVSGEAVYIDDMAVNDQLLFGYIYASPYAYAKIKSYDINKARKIDGIHAILSYKDIPGENQMGPVIHDEVVLAENEVNFIGQAIFIIAAENEDIARKAAKMIEVEYEILEPVLTIEDSAKKGMLLQQPRKIECGNTNEAFKKAENIIEGTLETGAQEHWYLETHVCLSVPGEGNEIIAYSSTQNPAETQALIAEVLNIPKMEVEVIMRRMGGAFGGKETQANHYAIWSALLCKKTNRPVKIRLFRDEDQKTTGKRHPFLINYKAAFDNNGIISAVEVELNANGGSSNDLTMAILERAMMHAENSYYIPNMKIIGKAWKTNLPSNTAFRGFGGPQGMAYIETIIDIIARKLNKDAAEIRYKNFFGINERNITPYGQKVENNRLYLIWDQLIKSSDYFNRRKQIEEYNNKNEFTKKGIAITPLKFGISFTTAFLNQAGALVNIYKDGTVLANHGGTEMGQGLHTKMKQIAATELGIDIENVKVNATNTSKVPNTSATAASSGTDMNGMAVKDATKKLKKRIATVLAEEFNKNSKTKLSKPENLIFENNFIYDKNNPDNKISFKEAVLKTYLSRVSLSATGFYKTPGVYFDREIGKGNPFFYYAFGMAVTEVQLDILTGSHKILRTDILHDAGKSINENIDIGQVEGAFIQGVGWCTTEECKIDEKGNLLNHSPDTYKIPGIQDIPSDFRVALLQGAPQPNTIRQSKAVGEPPFMLAFSGWLAIKDAISSVGNHKYEPDFSLPATNEVILLSIEDIKSKLSE